MGNTSEFDQNKPDKDYSKIIANSKIIYSDDINELEQLKFNSKMLQKKVFRLSIQGEKE